MTLCKACGKETHSMKYDLTSGAWYCRDCAPIAPSRINFDVKMTLSNGTRIGAAHYDDIIHRKSNPDGSVTRDTGRKYFGPK